MRVDQLKQERALGAPLPEQQLASKIALRYRASDGALVHGYLSLPPDKDASRLPLLTMVHGGPWAAFDGGYQTLVQLLDNRGFAVFQPDFRASMGYGEQYIRAPNGEGGKDKMVSIAAVTDYVATLQGAGKPVSLPDPVVLELQPRIAFD
ncbi:alpha/beta hydrolase family protein [Massilia sp. TWR1-2-2]|uniref:alpha/beta hydrolase family protein n=1 Tax=Massilia sp. TWR1-2-2 TaxID=2804584 RepID=UPI003CF825E2